jgi:hypothetical protein
MNINFNLKKAILAGAFLLIIVNCFGQYQCVCTFGNPKTTCIPDSIIELTSGLELAICGNIIHTKAGILFSDLSMTYCGIKIGNLVEEYNNEILLYINATDTIQLTIDGDTLTLIKMKWLPIGENFEFILIPYSFTDYYRVVIDEPPYEFESIMQTELLKDNIKLYSDSKIQKVWHIYDEMKSSNSAADKRLSGLLFMAAISGSEDLEYKLRTLKDEFMMDNDTNLYYQNLMNLLALWKNRKE